MSVSFKPLSKDDLASLRRALHRNGDGISGLLMGSTTEYLDEAPIPVDEKEDATDAQVINVIRSVPMHYGEEQGEVYGVSAMRGLYATFLHGKYTGITVQKLQFGKVTWLIRDPSASIGLVSVDYA